MMTFIYISGFLIIALIIAIVKVNIDIERDFKKYEHLNNK